MDDKEYQEYKDKLVRGDGKVIFMHPTKGDDNNEGTSLDDAVLTERRVYDLAAPGPAISLVVVNGEWEERIMKYQVGNKMMTEEEIMRTMDKFVESWAQVREQIVEMWEIFQPAMVEFLEDPVIKRYLAQLKGEVE